MLKKSLDLTDEASPEESPDRHVHGVVNLRDMSFWKDPPDVHFERSATLRVAQWVLVVFAAVYLLCFIVLMVAILTLQDATFDKVSELLQFMLTSIVPLVTLAVGYYLGHKTQRPK